jgi:sugar phosphate isomerase/epimerase
MLALKRGLRLECLKLPFRKALEKASQIGAEGVEINGRTELLPADMSRTAIRQVLKILRDLKLKVCAVNFPTRRGYDDLEDLDRRIDATKSALVMAYNLGCRVVTNRIGQIRDEAGSQERSTMIEALTEIGRFSQTTGAWLAARTGREDGALLKGLIDALPAMSIGVDFDPGEFTIHGHSADDAIRQLGAHVISFRARDAVRDLSLGRGMEVQLGRGSVDLPTMLAVLEENNYQGYIIIDRETDSEPVKQCTESLEYLTSLFA